MINLSVGYGTNVVLEEISMHVNGGSFCALLGPNGCGKTTVLKCVNGIIKPLAGTILIDGTDIVNVSRRRIAQLTGSMPSSTATPFNYSGRAMVVMGKAPHVDPWLSPGSEAEEEADEILASLGIPHLASKPFLEMSAGEQQLVILARVVLQNPALMLLDEPTSHLDLRNQVMLMERIKDISTSLGATVLVALHDPNLALRYCDHVALISPDGHMEYGGTREILNEESLSSVYGIGIKSEVTESGERVLLPVAGSLNRFP